MRTISYVSAPAGSGKTYGLAHHSVSEAKAHRKVLIAQPTKRLIRQTAQQIRAIDPSISVTAIYGKNPHDYPVRKVHDHIENAAANNGEVLLITHETLKRLNKANRRFWHLYVDEIPGVFNPITLKIALTHEHVTPYLEESELVPGISVITAKETARIEELIANPTGDQNIASFNRLLTAVLDPNQLVCIRTESYRDLLTNPFTTGHMDFFSILTVGFVDGFADVTFMGAHAEHSELVAIWSKMLPVTFAQHPALSKSLRYSVHENGHRLKLTYLFDQWSKSYSQTTDDEGTVLDRVRAAITPYMDGRRFLWQVNSEIGDAFFDPRDKLPHKTEGLHEDTFTSRHNVVLLSALNRSDADYKFLELLGIDRTLADITLGYQSDYQTMMRCSLRDPDAIAPVEVVVPTKGSAEWIAGHFPGCTVTQLEHGLSGPKPRGRPKKPNTLLNKDRKHNSLERKKAREAAARGEVYVPKLRT